MKKMLTLISIVLASILLTACSIPFGDGGKLEVSSDGINVDLGEEEEMADDEVEAAEKEEGTEEDTTEGDATADDAATDDDQTATTDTGAGSCSEFIEDQKANERFINALLEFTPPEFPLLDCQLMDSVNESYDSRDNAAVITARYSVQGHWTDVYDAYVDYFTDLNFTNIEKKQNSVNKNANLTGHLPEHQLMFSIDQRDSEEEDIVNIHLILYKFDEPREGY